MNTREVDKRTRRELIKNARDLERLAQQFQSISLRQSELVASIEEQQEPTLQPGDYVRYRSTVGPDAYGYVHHVTDKRVQIVKTKNGRNYFARAHANVFLIEKDVGTTDRKHRNPASNH